MATKAQNIFITKKEKLFCNECGIKLKRGDWFVGEEEKIPGTCFKCSPFNTYEFLAPGDVAMTRRSKKHSDLCAVLWDWNKRRKRFERKGQFVQAEAIVKARLECEADAEKRAEKNKKAAVVREVQDKQYIAAFTKAIRARYPNCPKVREQQIALHACEKYSGRVGRTVGAKQFDAEMIDRAVEAHIRHKETDYDNQFGRGKRKRDIRAEVKSSIIRIMHSWR